MLGRDWLWLRETKISFKFSPGIYEQCGIITDPKNHCFVIIDGMSIPLTDEDFNKASSSKNSSLNSDLSIEEITNMIKILSLRSEDNKQ